MFGLIEGRIISWLSDYHFVMNDSVPDILLNVLLVSIKMQKQSLIEDMCIGRALKFDRLQFNPLLICVRNRSAQAIRVCLVLSKCAFVVSFGVLAIFPAFCASSHTVQEYSVNSSRWHPTYESVPHPLQVYGNPFTPSDTNLALRVL
jgi:hypothetical protein